MTCVSKHEELKVLEAMTPVELASNHKSAAREAKFLALLALRSSTRRR